MIKPIRRTLFLLLISLAITYSGSLLALFLINDWDKSGVMGDAIGGLTAPFVNLIAAVLVYLSFEEQRATNSKQEAQIKKSSEDSLISQYLEIYGQLKSDIKSSDLRNNLSAVLIELEVLTTSIIISIDNENKSKAFLLSLLSIKADELRTLQLTMSPDQKNRLDYIAQTIANEKR